MDDVLTAMEERLLVEYWDMSFPPNMEEIIQAGLNPIDIRDPGTHAKIWDIRMRNMLRGDPHPFDLQPEAMAAWFGRCREDGPLFDGTAPRGHPFPWMFSKASVDLGMAFSHFFEIYVQHLDLSLDGVPKYNKAWFLINTCEKLWRMMPGNATRRFFIAVFCDASGTHMVSILDADDASLAEARSRLMLKRHEFGLPVERLVLRDGGHSQVVGTDLEKVHSGAQSDSENLSDVVVSHA